MRSQDSRKAPRTKGTGGLYMENVGKPNERAVATLSREQLTSYGLEASRELKFRSRSLRTLGGNVTAAKKEAQAKADKFLDEVKAGTVVTLRRTDVGPAPRAIVTLADWLERWLQVNVKPTFDRQGKRVSGLQPRTYDSYRYAVSKYILNPAYGLADVKLVALTPSQVEDFMVAMRRAGVGSSMVHKAVLVLGTALELAYQRHRETNLAYNPARSVANPRPGTKKKTWSTQDRALIGRLYQQAEGSRWAFALDLGLRLGLRRSEMAGLRFSDFRLFQNQLVLDGRGLRVSDYDDDGERVGSHVIRADGLKMRDERVESEEVLPIDGMMWAPLLKAQRGRVLAYYLLHRKTWTGPNPQDTDDAYVFPRANGEVSDPNYLTRWFGELVAAAGDPSKSIHWLRHCFVSKQLADGRPLWEVSILARHKNTQITEQVYGHRDEAHRNVLFAQTGNWLEDDDRQEAVNE